MPPPSRIVAAPKLSIRLLGPPVVERNGEPISVDTRKAIAMLVYLVLTGRPQPREFLTELLWPSQEADKARGALRRTLSVLNSALDGAGLHIDRRQIAFEAGDASVDVSEFRTLAARHEIDVLERAADLYHGDLLSGFGLRDAPEFDDWQLAQAEDLRREFARVLERLTTAYADRGDIDRALATARRWLACDPLMEPAHRRVMELLARSGDRSQALRQYRECVAVLERELGVEPLEETTELYEAIREDRLPPPARRAGIRTPATSTTPVPLVGRDEELGVLRQTYDSIGPDGRLIVIGGEPGIGKTRMAAEFIDSIRGSDPVVLGARCHPEEERMAFGVAIELLRAARGTAGIAAAPGSALIEAARLLPELAQDATPAAPLDSPAARRRLFDGVCDVLAAVCTDTAPGVVFVDDAQWADESSRDLLGFLVRRLRGVGLCVVLTWRTEEVPPGHPFRRMFSTANRAGLALGVTLARLSERNVADVVRGTGAGDDSLAATLYEESAGVPFFLVEYLAALRGGGAAVPAGVQDLLSSRVEGVSGTAAQILTAAAAIGRSFDPEVLRETSGRSPEEVAEALDELLAHGLVMESDGGYDFSHPKLRDYAYERATLARRRLLHARAAESLARGARRHPDVAALAAHHYERAGREADAAEHFCAAGDHARSVFANAEALAHYRSALALGHPDTPVLHEAVGDLLTLLGSYRDALASYETSAALGSTSGDVERKLGSVHHRLGDWDAADAYYAEALGAASPPPNRVRVLAERSLNAHRAGRTDEAKDHAREALEVASEAGDPRALAEAHNIAGILASNAGDEQARAHLEESLELAERLGDPVRTAAALNNLSLVLRSAGDVDRALSLAERALDLTGRVGDRHREAAVHSNLADLLRAAGRAEEALEHITTSAKIFAEVGEPDELQPEIWKLVEW